MSESLDDLFDAFTPTRDKVRPKPAPQIGDSVEWVDVPNGAMVRTDPDTGLIWHEVRYLRNGRSLGSVAGIHHCDTHFGNWFACPPKRDDPVWMEWPHSGPVTIVALGLTGKETPADMQRLAEIFAVHEALRAMNPIDFLVATGGIGPESRSFNISEASPLLHAAGWRPGMTPEQAAGSLSK